MTVPITPQYLATAVTVQMIELIFKPAWNGEDWVIDPANVIVRASVLLVDGETPAAELIKIFEYPALPLDGQTKVDDLRVFIEQQVADSYSVEVA